MNVDFVVGGIDSCNFGARLLSNYTVGSTPVNRSRLKATQVQGWIPLSTQYGLRSIYLPVYIAADTPRDAAENKSLLDAAMLDDPVELELPNGMCYTASLDSMGDVEEVTQDGREITCAYTLLGYAHDPLITTGVSNDQRIYAYGTAPEMDCRLTCTASADAASYQMAGVTWTGVKAGDVLVLDGLEKRVLRNGVNAFDACDLITWPTLRPGYNTLSAPDAITVEYYPIYL